MHVRVLDPSLDQSLDYYILSPSEPLSQHRHLHDKLYSMWKALWLQTYRELDGIAEITSDEFVRQDEAHALFINGEPVGVIMTKKLDLEIAAHRDMSYFKAYPAEIIQALRTDNRQHVISIGNLAVHPEWRKSTFGPLISETLVGLAVKSCQLSQPDAMIAYTRNNRKMNETAYRYGAVCIKSNHQAHNVAVDIVVFYPENVSDTPLPGIQPIVNSLWQKRRGDIAGKVPTPAPTRKVG